MNIEDATVRTGVLKVWLALPGCASLKEKRSRLKPLLLRLQRDFGAATAEIGRQDAWQRAVLAVAVVSGETRQVQRRLDTIRQWLQTTRGDWELIDEQMEIW